MSKTTLAIAAVLAASFALILGVILGRSQERVPATWYEPEDGVQPQDPYLTAKTRVPGYGTGGNL